MHRRALLTGAALAAGAAALTQPASAATTISPGRGKAGTYAPVVTEIQRYMEEHRRANALPGLTLSLADRDGYAALLTTGYADVDRRAEIIPETRFQIGSISKSFVAICCFRLMERGKLDLSARMRDVLPGVALPADNPITVEQVLHHVSGLPDDAPIFPRVPSGLLWLGFEPGSHWSYSNTGYHLLGLIVERLYGRPLAEVIQAEVLTPLGMTSTYPAILNRDRPTYAIGYAPYFADRPYPRAGRLGVADWVDVTEGAGCVASTASDMARYAHWLMEAGAGRGAPLMSDAAAKRFTTVSAPAPGWGQPDARYAYGMALVQVGGRTLLHHTGGMTAFSSSIHVDSEAGVGCFASTNVGETNYRPRDITAYACELMRKARGGGGDPKPKPVATPPIKTPEAYAGRFIAADGHAIDLAARNGALILTVGGESDPLEQTGDGQFLSHLKGRDVYPLAAVRAGEKGDSKVTGFWWGPTEYTLGAPAPRRNIPAKLRALAGRYESDSPWLNTFHVIARPDGLYAEGTDKIVEIEPGVWRVAADPTSPERIRFDGVINGVAQRLNFSGEDFVRRPD